MELQLSLRFLREGLQTNVSNMILPTSGFMRVFSTKTKTRSTHEYQDMWFDYTALLYLTCTYTPTDFELLPGRGLLKNQFETW